MKGDLKGVIRGLQIVIGLVAVLVAAMIVRALAAGADASGLVPLIGLLAVNVMALGLSLRAMNKRAAPLQNGRED